MRKNASKATLTQAEIRQQLIQQANQAQEKFKESEYAEEFADEIVPNVRAEVAPPPNTSSKGSGYSSSNIFLRLIPKKLGTCFWISKRKFISMKVPPFIKR